LALGDSGWFAYLRNLDSEKFVLNVEQDETNFAASILSESKTPERAKSIASSLNMFISLGTAQTNNENDKLFLESMKVISIESSFKIALVVPQSKFQESLSRALNKPITNE
jgi:hypothetical protein